MTAEREAICLLYKADKFCLKRSQGKYEWLFSKSHLRNIGCTTAMRKLRSCRCPLRKQKWLAKKSITKTIACFTYPNMSCRYYRCLNALCEKKIIETPWCDFTSSWEEREEFKKPSLFSFALLLLISSLCAIFVNTSRVIFTKEAIFWTNSSN